MQWQYSLFTPILFLAAAISVIVAVMAWRRRQFPGAVVLALLMTATTEWMIADGLEIAAVDTWAKILWSKAGYIGFCSAPVLFFMFAYEYARPDKDLSWRTRILLSAVPFITLLMAATNDWHGLVWSSFTPTVQSGTLILIYGRGTWFWIAAVYFYALVFAAAGALAWAVGRFPAVYRLQGGVLIAAAAMPLIGGLIYLLRLGPIRGLDTTPISIVLAGPLLGWDILGLRLFDLIPVARHALIETMSDGVLVLDERQRIADVNPAARQLMALGGAPLIGYSAARLPAPWPDIVARHCLDAAAEVEVVTGRTDPSHVDVRVSLLRDRRGSLTGYLMVVRDITERKRVENALRASQEHLEMQLQEKKELHHLLHEQAVRDPLTSLFNRRYLEETLVRELARATRDGSPVSLLMFDLDKFKQINDKLGHAAGDVVLRAVAQVLAGYTRRGDVACRYGGDEFIVVLANTGMESACGRAGELLVSIGSLNIPYADHVLSTKASCGIALFPDHSMSGDTLILLADRALYAAKAEGGNSVVVWGQQQVMAPWL